jgi:carbon monoxide dehydrogenase subunit G
VEIVNEFTVNAAPDRVFRTLLDFERLGPCVPGASIGARDEEGIYPAQIAVRLGPMRLNYRGTVRLADSDEADRHAVMVADVREVRGQGAARAQMTMDVSKASGGAQVVSKTEVDLSGRAAQMGAGIVEDVAARLVADMAANLEQLLQSEAKPPAPPAAGSGGPSETASPVSATTAPAVQPPPPTASPAAAKPINGFQLLLGALWHRLRHGRRSRPGSRAVSEE